MTSVFVTLWSSSCYCCCCFVDKRKSPGLSWIQQELARIVYECNFECNAACFVPIVLIRSLFSIHISRRWLAAVWQECQTERLGRSSSPHSGKREKGTEHGVPMCMPKCMPVCILACARGLPMLTSRCVSPAARRTLRTLATACRSTQQTCSKKQTNFHVDWLLLCYSLHILGGTVWNFFG